MQQSLYHLKNNVILFTFCYIILLYCTAELIYVNHSYRVFWNRATTPWQAESEITHVVESSKSLNRLRTPLPQSGKSSLSEITVKLILL